jgi:uncharacterized Fe-S cluster-containing radical SAM superfamily protein
MTDYARKMFGRDMGMRSTFVNYDPCVTGKTATSVKCQDCMVSLISDRFLGERFTKEVLSKKYNKPEGLFTYVLIADTIGCNLNCWFCYAWKYLELKDASRCHPEFLSPVQLAKQFDCKIRKTANLSYMKSQVASKTSLDNKDKEKILKHLDKELPFSRIRISGGEPMFSNSNVFQSPTESAESQNLIIQTIKYWIQFFEEFDNLVGQIKKENLLNISTFDSTWQKLTHPVWLTEVKNRIMGQI